jgi:hypothetical protein
LVELHYHVKALVRNMQLVDAQWRDIIDEAIELEELLSLAVPSISLTFVAISFSFHVCSI